MLQAPILSPCHVSPWLGLEGEVLGLGLGLAGQVFVNITGLQVVAIRVTCRKTITVCSIYLPPSMAFNDNDFYDLLHQLPPPILITGDFNSHSTLWGCTTLDRPGKMVEDIVTKHNLCILNDSSWPWP